MLVSNTFPQLGDRYWCWLSWTHRHNCSNSSECVNKAKSSNVIITWNTHVYSCCCNRRKYFAGRQAFGLQQQSTDRCRMWSSCRCTEKPVRPRAVLYPKERGCNSIWTCEKRLLTKHWRGEALSVYIKKDRHRSSTRKRFNLWGRNTKCTRVQIIRHPHTCNISGI